MPYRSMGSCRCRMRCSIWIFLALRGEILPLQTKSYMSVKKILMVLCSVYFFAAKSFSQQASPTYEALIHVDLNKEIAPMKPVWAWFGYDEPNYTYMKDGKKLLSEIAALSPVPVYVRAHNMLTTGDGKAALKWGSTNAYTEDANGNPVYNWTIVDSIFDTYIKRG